MVGNESQVRSLLAYSHQHARYKDGKYMRVTLSTLGEMPAGSVHYREPYARGWSVLLRSYPEYDELEVVNVERSADCIN
jgi:hypothetical protein